MTDSLWPVTSIVILAIIVLLGILLIWRVWKDRRSGFPAQDERTRKLTGRATYYAFYIGSYFMIALMVANLLNQELAGAPLLDAGYALAISVMVQGLSYLGCWWYFNRTGEVA